MKQYKLLNGLALAALATAALATVACGSAGASPTEEEPEPERPAPTIQFGTLEPNEPGEVVPEHRSPRPGGSISGSTPEFQWTDVPGASGFQVQVSEDAKFPEGNTIDSGVIDDLSWTLPVEIAAGKTYYWRARAVFPLGAVGGWSDYSPFSSPIQVTETLPPGEGSGESSENGTNTDGITVAVGDRGAVVASLAIWDAASDVLLTKNGRGLEEVLTDLKPGRIYQFVSTLDMVIYPREFGFDREPIRLTGGKQRLVFW